MTKDELSKEYFEWIYQLVCDDKRLSYRKLLNHLHNIEFVYFIGMDGNRAEDGIDLRYRFGYERDYEYPMIAAYLDRNSCSVLEMITALAIRCEEHIMDDPDIGDRTGQWFWYMIKNLGLYSMSDNRFNADQVNSVISRFLNRQYGKNGKGGLFTVEKTERDLREVEIWYQMCWYLDDII